MDIVQIDRTAVLESARIVRSAGPGDWDRPSPCSDWTLRRLVEHMGAQHHGFAAAARGQGAGPADPPVRGRSGRPVRRGGRRGAGRVRRTGRAGAAVRASGDRCRRDVRRVHRDRVPLHRLRRALLGRDDLPQAAYRLLSGRRRGRAAHRPARPRRRGARAAGCGLPARPAGGFRQPGRLPAHAVGARPFAGLEPAARRLTAQAIHVLHIRVLDIHVPSGMEPNSARPVGR
ncbi:maleylpyruvate isomerase N-terminal domain-containing protein [Streptomyces sp. ITFR-6]|uniref:maleylpyruvate isomerase N-terminal domain-containing protein n=1 Tax=Streptomyces sp. ITFR-6 TaxID=3075197 RepID=UPI0037DA6C2D